MISIVIVSLNTKNNLNKTIKSILHQTSKKFEIIIIDGNSSDGSINLIKKYKKHFSKIIIEKDKGIYDAMNKGIKISNKPWIIFLNSGDTFYNKFVIQNLRLILKKNKFADIVVGNNLTKISNILIKSNRTELNEKTIGSCFSHQCTIVKTALMKKIYLI